VKIKEALVDNLDFINNEYESLVEERAYSDYLFTQRALDIMYADGNLKDDFNKYYTKEIKNESKKNNVLESDIVHLVVKKIRECDNKEELKKVFSIVEKLSNDNEEDDTTLYLYLIEVLFQNKEDIDKYFQYLGSKLIMELKSCFEGWGPDEMVGYIDNLIFLKDEKLDRT